MTSVIAATLIDRAGKVVQTLTIHIDEMIPKALVCGDRVFTYFPDASTDWIFREVPALFFPAE